MAGPSMIGMTILQCTGKDNLGTIFTQCPDQFSLIYFIILKKSVGHTQILTDIQIHDTGCCFRFLLTYFRSSASAKFPTGQIDNTDGFSMHLFHHKRARTTKFHIIGMHRYGEYLNFFHAANYNKLTIVFRMTGRVKDYPNMHNFALQNYLIIFILNLFLWPMM